MNEGIGPQNPGDDPLCERLRFHQSWYRSAVLRVGYGRGPTSRSLRLLGNMLDEESAAQGANFLTPEIHQLVLSRLGSGAIERYRCVNNMLSSQPMCFNLFGPLVGRPDRATRLFRAAFSDEVAQVSDVRIEYAPNPKTEYTGDGSSFDASVTYKRRDGSAAFFGIETKFSESFSPTAYPLEGMRKSRTEDPRSPWIAEKWPLLTDARWNQLWRNHLLIHAMLVNHPEYSRGRLLLVRHDTDGDVELKAAGYAALLKDQTSFSDVKLGSLLDAWQAVAIDDYERDWLRGFRQRYVDLSGSELAFQTRLKAGRPAMAEVVGDS